jgi:hypothetical protein
MGVYRTFVQASPVPSTVPANQYPNNSTITDANLTTSSAIVIQARPTNNRRGLIIENDGTLPMIFSLGTTVSVAARTALLFPNDIYEDTSGWQGGVAAASVGGNGAANFTEMVFI